MSDPSPQRIASGAQRARELLREARAAEPERARELLREAEQIQYGIDSHAQRLATECDES